MGLDLVSTVVIASSLQIYCHLRSLIPKVRGSLCVPGGSPKLRVATWLGSWGARDADAPCSLGSDQ